MHGLASTVRGRGEGEASLLSAAQCEACESVRPERLRAITILSILFFHPCLLILLRSSSRNKWRNKYMKERNE